MNNQLGDFAEYQTIVIAWLFAKVYGNNQAAAIRKCARRIRDKTKSDNIFKLCKKIISQGDDDRVVKSISMSAEGIDSDDINLLTMAKIEVK